MSKTDEETVNEVMNRVEAKDAGAMCQLGCYYYNGQLGLSQDREKALELYARAANLGYKKAHNNLAGVYHEGGDMKKAKFHFEAAAMAGCDDARYNLGIIEGKSENVERALKHWKIAASAGNHNAMQILKVSYNKGLVSRDIMDSTLTAYNSSCVEMRSEARDAAISKLMLLA
jgi:TPR repeat protein